MANLRREDIEQVVVEKRPGYVLELTTPEVGALLAVFSKIGGDPEFSPRKHIKSISDRFSDIGVFYSRFAAYDLLESTARGTLKFNNYGSRDDTED